MDATRKLRRKLFGIVDPLIRRLQKTYARVCGGGGLAEHLWLFPEDAIRMSPLIWIGNRCFNE